MALNFVFLQTADVASTAEHWSRWTSAMGAVALYVVGPVWLFLRFCGLVLRRSN